MTHSHVPAAEHGGPTAPVVFGRGVRTAAAAVVLVLLAATVAGIVLLRPTGATAVDERLGLGGEQVGGTVSALRLGPCPGVGSLTGAEDAAGAGAAGEGDAGGAVQEQCATVTVTLDDGPDAGEVVVLTEAQGTSSRQLAEGDGLVLARAADLPLETRYQIVDLQRGPPLAALAVLFALAVVAVGRWRGLAALVGLGTTFAVLTLFVLPALLEGRPPLQVAVVGAAAIMFVSLYLAHGVSVRTTVALCGTLVSLALTGLLAGLFVALGDFSGLVSEEAIFLSAAAVEIDLRGLLLAGILIGALGVLDDVTVTQTSAVFELHAANPGMSRARLAAGAMRIGRDHIASTVNTLVLAYAGASLPLLLLFVLAAQPVGDTLTNEVVAQEVVRALVGGIGIVASVPLTTALAVLVAPRARPAESPARAEAADGDGAGAGGGDGAAGDGHRDGGTGGGTTGGQDGTDPATDAGAIVPGLGGQPTAGTSRHSDAPDESAADPDRVRVRAADGSSGRERGTGPEVVPDVASRPGAGGPRSRGRRGSRALRAEQEAEELLRGLRPSGPMPGAQPGPRGPRP